MSYKMNKINQFLLTWILLFGVLSGQIERKNTSYQSLYSYWLEGIIHTVDLPANRWILGGAFLGAGVAYQSDNKVKYYVQENGLIPTKLSIFGDLYGGTWGHWLLLSVIVLDNRYLDSTQLYDDLKYAFMALGTNGVTTYIIKRTVGRERPNESDYLSFPSGHTSHSFTIAAIAHEIYGSKIGIPAYTLALIVAANRLQDNKHYLSDVLFGAGLGTAIGRGFAQPYNRKNTSLSIYPDLKGNIRISYTF